MSTLSIMQSDKRNTEAELNKAKKRLRDVESINSGINTGFDDDIGRINSHNESIITNSTSGIKQNSNIAEQNEVIRRMKEKTIHNDGNLSGVRDGLRDEIQRLNKKISELEADIKSLNTKIEDEKKAEKEKKEAEKKN